MFLKKKRKELTDQLAVYQERGAPRWGAPHCDLNAVISISGFEGEGLLGNVSISGCSMESVTYVALMPTEVYEVKITTGPEDVMPPIVLRFKLSWTKCSEEIFRAGFSIEDNKKNPQLKRYVDLLRTRGVVPDYGNKKMDKD